MDTIFLLAYAGSALRIVLLTFVGIPLLLWSKNQVTHVCSQRFSRHSCILLGRVVAYAGIVFIAVTVLHELGFNVSALLGVAGVCGVAIGFASQTSISNIISGFFLVLERPFSIGDTIKVYDIIGIVESIDLLSMSIRTTDNKLVRLPNEIVLKSNITNVTYYDIKRLDFVLSVPYAEDVEHIKTEMYGIINKNEFFLRDPKPVIMLQKIGQHDYDTEIRVFLTVRIWVARQHYTTVPDIFMQQLKEQFDKSKQVITITHTNQS